MALGDIDVGRAGGVEDVGLRGEDLVKAPEPGLGLLERLGEVEQLLDGGGERGDVERVGGEVHRRHLAHRDEVAAIDDDDGEQRAHERRDHGLVTTHDVVHALLALEVGLVRPVDKLLQL